MATLSLRRGSIVSFGSVLLPHRHDEDFCLEDMSDEELRKMLEQILLTNRVLKVENDIFERYLKRNDPHSLQAIIQSIEMAKQRVMAPFGPMSTMYSGSVISLRDRATPSIFSLRSSSRYVSPSRLISRVLKVPLAHRMEMAKEEIDELRKELSQLEETVKKKRKTFRAKSEEVDVRIRETREAEDDLDEYVAVKGVDPISGKIPAEKIVRFMEEWLKTAETIIERIRLKSTTLKAQIMRTKQQLAQREDLGETLRAVDFEKLKIENEDYVRKIEEKHQYLLDMKKITGFYGLEMTKHKEKLGNLVSTLNTVKEEITEKEYQIENLKTEYEIAQAEVETAEKQLTSLLTLMEKYEVPDILDFVKLREELASVTRIYKQLERRKNVERITFQSRQKQMEHVPQRSNDSGLTRYVTKTKRSSLSMSLPLITVRNRVTYLS